MVFEFSGDETRAAIQRSGLEAKVRVDFRHDNDQTTVVERTFASKRMPRELLLNENFDELFIDLPGKAILLTDPNVKTEIDRQIDFETVGPHAVLIFPVSVATLQAIKKKYYGRNTMVLLNHYCPRSKFVARIHAQLPKFLSLIHI